MGASNADYERQFKEIVAKAKAVYGTGACDDSTLEFLIPGLRESEDERIRKALLGLAYLDGIEPILTQCSVTRSDILSYLEKQKESTWTEEDESFRKHILPRILDPKGWTMEQIEADRKLLKEFVERQKNKWGEKQKEQNPAQTDDEKEYIRTLNSLISDFIRDKQPEDVAFYQKIYDWLDGRHIEQEPAEWSEEEERLINTSISFLKDFADTGWENAVECIDWLKSLRPSWKPSEEQMEALEECGECKRCIKDLCEQLKKRM